MVTLTKVVIDNLYETIHSFVESNKVIIEDYEGMVNLNSPMQTSPAYQLLCIYSA